jgi:hypothetical protein
VVLGICCSDAGTGGGPRGPDSTYWDPRLNNKSFTNETDDCLSVENSPTEKLHAGMKRGIGKLAREVKSDNTRLQADFAIPGRFLPGLLESSEQAVDCQALLALTRMEFPQVGRIIIR